MNIVSDSSPLIALAKIGRLNLLEHEIIVPKAVFEEITRSRREYARKLYKWGIQKPEYELSEVETTVSFRSGGKAIVISEIEKTGVELNERQKKALRYVLEKGFITNRSYQELNDVGKKTAYLELSGLMEKGLLLSTGKGRSVRYVARF